MESNFFSQELLRVGLLSLPLIIGGIVHMVIVKCDFFPYFKKPIHASWFGQNKTWRGFIVMPLATWTGVVLSQNIEALVDLNTPLLIGFSSWSLAFLMGLGYCLAELPNSFLKRRLGVKEGQTSQKFKWFFIILDQADSAIGCMIILKFVLIIPLRTIIITIIFGTILHLVLNILLYKMKIRKNPY